ncbi:MAG: hypothetical protein J6B85_06030 [Lachnospiraceae bacterium]|nr:hypothetical protein [Lachnospiraceae bacterium]
MQAASEAYKAVMKEKCRNVCSYVRVTLGVVNQEAQSGACVSSPEAYTYFSNVKKPFDNYSVTERYALCEEDFCPVDGSCYFLPREGDPIVLNQGLITEAILGTIEIRFPYAMDLKGLTIEFGNTYPVDFSILSDVDSVEVIGNTSGHYVTELIFHSATFLRIVPASMSNGNGRLHIEQITMGIGLYFDGKRLLATSKREHVSPISEEIPTLDYTASMTNQDRMFDVENENSVLHFLQIGQSVEVEYGQELPDGSVEWIPGLFLLLREWSADDDEMSISASDRFEDLNETYYRGAYHPDGVSLFELAVEVLTDAGLDDREYWLDPCLKSVIVHNPIPVTTHKEAIQMIANAGRCALMQDRNGRIRLKSSFHPVMTASSDNAAYFSDTSGILEESEKDSYALAGRNLTDVISNQYFLPREGSAEYRNVGYVSKYAAGSDGTFPQNPTVEIHSEAAVKCFGLTLKFGKVPPKEMQIHTYLDGTFMESFPVSGLTETTEINHEFPEFDRMVLEFLTHEAGQESSLVFYIDEEGSYLTDENGYFLVEGNSDESAGGGLRVILHQVRFGQSTDYRLEYGVELTKTPKGTQLAKTKTLQIVRTIYTEGTERKEIAKETVSGDGSYLLRWSNPASGIQCTITDAQDGQTAVIAEQGSYYAIVLVSGISGSAEIAITGQEYTITEGIRTKELSPSGTVRSWKNPLISEDSHAARLADWIGDYLSSDREYDISYRGEPRIDGNDSVYLENKYIPDMMVRVEDHTLNTSRGALSGSVKARRVI